MEIVLVNSKKEKKAFKKFRQDLYKNDPYYVSTAEFTLDMLLYQQTEFSKTLSLQPVMAVEDGKILIESLLIHNPKDDYLQVSFFEAVEGIAPKVHEFMEFVKGFAKSLALSKIIIGLNGHLSYGVGLSSDMPRPNTFDSTYSKVYYTEYFKNHQKHELVAFSNNPATVFPALSDRNSNVNVRPIDLKKFDEEMEIFRNICNETIGKTFLFTQTDKHHFRDLIKDMLFFLEPQNILFAEVKGEVVGFLFWHPDYNEILKKGANNSLLEIATRYTLFKNKITKVKLNSIGVKEGYQFATIALLREMGKLVKAYDKLETNFVWCNNKKSMAINKHLLKNVERNFVVYEVEV